MSLSRRDFMGRAAAVGGGALFTATTLQTIGAHAAWADGDGRRHRDNGYGPLAVKPAVNTADVLVALPKGFAIG